jgi:hypothetical protein
METLGLFPGKVQQRVTPGWDTDPMKPGTRRNLEPVGSNYQAGSIYVPTGYGTFGLDK